MEFQDLKVGDVVYGPLPHQDGWEKHYGVVLRLADDWAEIVSGTSRGIPRGDDGLLPVEFVVRRQSDLTAAGLQKPTRFNVATHRKSVVRDDVGGLSYCGTVVSSRALVRGVVSAVAHARHYR